MFSCTERKPVAYFSTVFLSNLVFGTKYLAVPTSYVLALQLNKNRAFFKFIKRYLHVTQN